MGVNLSYQDPVFDEMENLGEEVLKHCAFALVGGGIGERLHSPYIKLSLTSDLVRDQSFLGDYCSYFHAIEVTSPSPIDRRRSTIARCPSRS